MKKLDYFKISHSIDPKLTGGYDACAAPIEPYDEDHPNSIYNYDASSSSQPFLPELILPKGYIPMDFIDCSVFHEELLISKKVKNILSSFGMITSDNCFPINLYDSSKKPVSNEYYMLYPPICSLRNIDFNNSELIAEKYGCPDSKFEVFGKISTEELLKKSSGLYIRSNKVTFESIPEHLFHCYIIDNSSFMVSDLLKLRFLAENVSGLEFKEISHYFLA